MLSNLSSVQKNHNTPHIPDCVNNHDSSPKQAAALHQRSVSPTLGVLGKITIQQPRHNADSNLLMVFSRRDVASSQQNPVADQAQRDLFESNFSQSNLLQENRLFKAHTLSNIDLKQNIANNPALTALEGVEALNFKQYALAKKKFKEALSKDPELLSAWSFYAYCFLEHFDVSDSEEMVSALRKAKEVDPTFEARLSGKKRLMYNIILEYFGNQEERKTAAIGLKTLFQKSPDTKLILSAKEWVLYAIALSHLQDPQVNEDACDAILKAYAIDPAYIAKFIPQHLLQCICIIGRSLSIEAIQFAIKILKTTILNNNEVMKEIGSDAWSLYCSLLIRSGNYNEAIAAANDGVHYNLSFASIWGYIAIAYFRIGNYEKAEDSAKIALVHDPKNLVLQHYQLMKKNHL